MEFEHVSVLPRETLELLAPHPGDIIVDATVGDGGHSLQIGKRIQPNGILIGLDVDEMALKAAGKRLSDLPIRVELRHKNFRYLDLVLDELNIENVDAVLFDLGLRMEHISQSGRGISFQAPNEPLDMRLGQDGELTAREVVNEWSESTLADVIYGFGGEKKSRQIARAIIEARKSKSIETVGDLLEVIEKILPTRGRRHQATKIFQALRIAVNDETGALQDGLERSWNRLRPGGRIVVITFHSLEDRIVKHYFKEKVLSGAGELLAKKAIKPRREELLSNSRSRSAVLRGIKKQQ